MDDPEQQKGTSRLAAYGVPALAILGLLLWAFRLGDWPLIAVGVLGGLPLLWETVRSVLRGRWNVDLIAIASILGGLLLGQYLAAAIIVLMMSGGEALEAFALRRASGALRLLRKEQPRLANRWDGKDYAEVPAEELEVGDKVLVRAGESVPTDGRLAEGESDFNEALLTGESAPVRHGEGDRALAGSVNLTAPVVLAVSVPAGQSTYAQLVELVRQAQGRKAAFQRLADRFGAWFTPITFGMVLLAWLLSHDAVTAYAVLVIATPCPLILATPVAVIAGIGRAARLGVVVKSGQALEGAARVGAVLFDKTGTLTAGSFSLVETEASHDEGEALRQAAALARFSNHAVSRSLAEMAGDRGLPKASDVAEVAGKGLRGKVDGKVALLGSPAFLQEEGVRLSGEERAAVGSTQVCLAVGGRLAAVFTLQDELRPESRRVVAELRRLGVGEIAMLTGDRLAVARAIGRRLGSIRVQAELRPEDKLRLVAEVSRREGRRGRTALMVGDGINDAPALERADVGVAIGKQGGEIAVEAADIVLLGNRLERLPDAIRIGRAVLRIAGAGIWFGMGASFIGMVAALLGYLPPVTGAVLQEGIDVLVILNALRVLRA